MKFHQLRAAAMTAMILAVAAGPRVPEALGDPPRTDPTHPAPGRMFVVGRVLDPSGRPVPGARVIVRETPRQPGVVTYFGVRPSRAIGRARTDASGRFRIEAPRVSSAADEQVGALAIAPGFGAGWAEFDPDADRPDVEVRLQVERVLRGRLLDPRDRPAVGVRVSVEAMGRPVLGSGMPADRVDGPSRPAEGPLGASTAWPRPATTDADGRFHIRGTGKDLRVVLGVDDPRFARRRVVIEPGNGGETTAALEPARVILGRITFGDTGRPVVGAAIVILSYQAGRGRSDEYRTDADGRYRANPPVGDRYSVNVYLDDGQPYLNASTATFAWDKGATERRVDLILQQGVTLHGRVTEEGTGWPVAGAELSFIWPSDGRNQDGPREARVISGPDGSYRLAARPGPGTLLAMGPSEDYVYREFESAQLLSGKPGGMRRRAHAFLPCVLDPDEDERRMDVVLRRGATVEMRVVDPDGKPAHDVWMFCRIVMPPSPVSWRSWYSRYHRTVRDGRCQLHGLDPDAKVPVYFLDPKNRLGATAILSGRSGSNGPVVVRLAPCATARARLVDRDGKPVAGYVDRRLIVMVVTPGGSRVHGRKPGEVFADRGAYAEIVPTIYDPIASGADGRIELPALIPGASYCVSVSDPGPRGKLSFHRDLIPRPGETIDLGDVLIRNPPARPPRPSP